MTTQELLTPRVIVTAWYPGCPFEVGDVLTYLENFLHRTDGTPESLTCSNVYRNGNNIAEADDVEKATANFRALSWYEHRKVEDMPEYVKIEGGKYHGYYCIREWNTDHIGNFWALICKGSSSCQLFMNSCAPATKQEYIDYVNATTNKYGTSN